MEEKLFEDIRIALKEKEAILNEWLETASEEEKRLQLGPAAPSDVNAQIESIDNATSV